MEATYGLMTIVGPILLAAVIIWAIMRNRQRTPREEARTEEATRQMYDAQDHDDKANEVR